MHIPNSVVVNKRTIPNSIVVFIQISPDLLTKEKHVANLMWGILFLFVLVDQLIYETLSQKTNNSHAHGPTLAQGPNIIPFFFFGSKMLHINKIKKKKKVKKPKIKE